MQETNAHQSEETSLRDMAAVHGLLLRMAQCHSLDELFSLVTDHLGRLHDAALCRIWLMEQADPQRCAACRHFYECPEHRRCLRLAAGYGQSRVNGEIWSALDGSHQRFPLGRGKVGLIAASGEAFHVDDVSPGMAWVSDPDWIAREGIRTFLGQPLTHKGEVLGVLALFSRSRHDGLALDRLRLIADYLAVSLANAQQFEELTRLKRRLEIENSYLQRDSADPGPFLVGESPAMRNLKERIRRVAFTAAPVLITGEVGTGKGAVAAELHRQSALADGPLVKVDCAAISPAQFEREFFGERQGDAVHVGFLEAAGHGTLLLENVNDIPLEVQGKLLGIIHSGTFLRPGDRARRPVQTRFLAATHADLIQQVRQGRFREDLYYQLNVLALDMPPCGNARRTFRCWPPIFLTPLPPGSTARPPRCPRMSCLSCRPMTGPAMSGNCAISCCGPSSPPRTGSLMPVSWPQACGPALRPPRRRIASARKRKWSPWPATT